MWEEEVAPLGRKIIHIKWVLKKKRNEDGDVVRYKGRLTVHEFTPVPGYNYDETFAAVVPTDTLSILLTHTLQRNLAVRQYDLEDVYLRTPLEEEM
jgi:hypothetical protein